MTEESDSNYIALHNPSSLTINQAQISVPSDQYLLFSEDDSEYVDTDILCFNVTVLIGNQTQDV